MYKISSNPAVWYHEQQLRCLETGIERAKRAAVWSWLCFGASIISMIATVYTGVDRSLPSLVLLLVWLPVTFCSFIVGLITVACIPSMYCTLEQQRMLPVDEDTKMIVTDGFLGRKVTYVYEP